MTDVVNLGKLTKPATTLINKISDAIGVLYEPTRITRKAKAEAEAKKIKALGAQELEDMNEERARKRMIAQEMRRQDNITEIIRPAIARLDPTAESERIEEDWIAHFFRSCEDISDSEMQSLWSNILLREARKPGTISKRTVNIVASLDKSDAELFTKLCQFCVVNDDHSVYPLIYEYHNKIYEDEGVTYTSLLHLSSIGLITFLGNDVHLKLEPDERAFKYFDKKINMEITNPDNKFPVGIVALSEAGGQLYWISGAVPNKTFLSYVNETLITRSITLTEVET